MDYYGYALGETGWHWDGNTLRYLRFPWFNNFQVLVQRKGDEFGTVLSLLWHFVGPGEGRTRTVILGMYEMLSLRNFG